MNLSCCSFTVNATIFITGAYTQKFLRLPLAQTYHQAIKVCSLQNLDGPFNPFANIGIFLSLSST